MALLIPLGLVCRFVPIGLPQIVVKYGGSFLWAAMVYLLVALLLPALRPIAAGVIAAAIAIAVEYGKLLTSPGLNSFRETFTGKVMLGRYFSYKDIAVYCVAIVCAAWIDHRLTQGRSAAKG